jgi:hypothetical protein
MIPYFVDSKPHFCYHFSLPENQVRLGFYDSYFRKVLPKYYKCM